MAFLTFDDIQWGYCDSSGRVEAQLDPAKRFSQDNPQHLEEYVYDCQRFQVLLGGQLRELKQQTNQTEGKSSYLKVLAAETACLCTKRGPVTLLYLSKLLHWLILMWIINNLPKKRRLPSSNSIHSLNLQFALIQITILSIHLSLSTHSVFT